jgi:catechol 2,3-dioxygenase-like lactoylglutathione lyase family enzyme
MTLETLAPILTTDDMDRSVRFYVDVLGSTCGMQTPGYSNLYHDAVRIKLAARNEHEESEGPKFTGRLYIGLQTAGEVDALWAKVKDRADVICAADDFDHGAHEFGVRDDNGYHLALKPRNQHRIGRPEAPIQADLELGDQK